MGLAASPAFADDRYWDFNQTAGGSGGSGLWNTADFFWSPNDDGVSGPYNAAWDNGALDHAIFGGTAGTVTLGSPITANALTFDTAGYTIAGSGGNILTLAGTTPTITVNSGTSTISAVIAGSEGLTKAGAGGLTLSGANSFTGGVTVSAGTLTLDGASTFTGNISVSSGATLSAASDAALGASDNTITLNGGTLTATGTLTDVLDAGREVIVSGSATISGAGVGSALFTGAGTLTVSHGVTMSNDANTYTGETRLNGAGQGRIYFTSVRDTDTASSLGSSGDIVIQGVNNFVDQAIYTGDGDSTDRTFRLTPSSNGGVALVNQGGGTLALTGTISLEGSDRGISFSASTADLDLSGLMSGTSNSTISYGGGGTGRTITLGGANTYTGFNSIAAVTVSVSTIGDWGANSSLGTSMGVAAGSTHIQINNGVLDYSGDGDSSNRNWLISNGSSLLNNGTGGLELTGAVSFDPVASIDTLTLGGTFAGENTISGAVAGSGGVIMNGAGTWVLGGNNTYTGPITVESGTLRADSASALGASGAVTVNDGTLDLNGNSNTFTRLDGSGGQVALGGADLTLNVADGVTATYAGSIAGAGNLHKTGAGKQVLTGVNTYTGSTNIALGTLELSFAGAGGPTSDIVAPGSTLNMSGGTLMVTGVAGEGNTQTFDNLNITGGGNNITATNATVNLGAVNRTSGLIDFGIGTGTTMTVDAGTTLGGWATVNGSDYADVNASNEIVAFTDYDLRDDAGTWLDDDIVADTDGTANSPFFGTVSDAGGDNIVQLGGLRYAAAQNSTVTVDTGQTLGVDGAIIVGPDVGGTTQTIQGGSVRGSAGGVLGIQQSSAGTFTINSTVIDNAGPTGFTLVGTGITAGTGKVVLGNAANTYEGVTRVTRGTLEVGTLANGDLPSSIGASSADPANLVLEAGRLRYTGDTASTDRGLTLMRSGAVLASAIDVAQEDTNLTVGGELVSPDGAGLVKEGAGTLTLTNANSSYTGVTTVNAGTLAVARLADGGDNSSIGASSSDSANLVISNTARLQYVGETATSNRGFTLGSGTLGATIDVSSSTATLTLSGNAVGSNNLVKDGEGVLVLAGNNTYNSNTVAAGTLRAGSTTAFGNTAGLMRVESGARLELDTFSNTVGGLLGVGTVDLGTSGTTLTLNGRTGNFTGTITGAGGLALIGGAVQTLNGCNHDYTGPTSINGSTLSTDCIRDGGVASSIGESDAASENLVLANSGVLEYTGGDVSIDRGFTLSGGWGYIDVQQADTELEFEGDVVGAGGLSKRDAGTLILSGTNTYTGGTVVEAGTLVAGSSSAFGTGILYIHAGATVDTTGFNTTVSALSDNNTAGGEILIADKTLTLTGATATFAGRITGTTGSLVKQGGGIQTLSGCDNSYGGRTVIDGGWISVACLDNGGVNSSIGSSSADASNLVIGGTSDGVLSYLGTGGSTNRGFTMGRTAYIRNYGSGAINFTNTAAIAHTGTGARQLRLGGTYTGGANILAAQIVDNGASAVSLIKEEAATWRLTNTNSSFTGTTTISSGRLEVVKLADGGEASSIGAAAAANTNLAINTEAHLVYIGTGDSTNRLFRLGTGTTYIESSGTGAINFSGTGGGAMGFIGGGPRTLALDGSYTGDNIMGVVIADENVTTGKTTLAKNGAGTWILTGNNTYTGNTVINDGKLIIGNGATTGNVGTGEVILAFSTGTLGFNRSDTVNFAGQISGPGIIEQMGEGTTNLTAVNSAGTTKITEGTLQVNGDLTTDTISFEDDEATTLTVNGTVGAAGGATTTFTGDAGASTIAVNGGGTLRAAGDLGGGSDAVTLAGTLDTGAGTLGLGGGTDTLTLNDGGAIAGGVTGGAGTDTLQVNNSGAVSLAGGSFAGFESLTKTLGGTLTLTGDHGYSAGTTIAAGTLQIGNGATAGALATPTVANNGILAFNLNSDYSFAGAISGSGAVTKLGTGTTTLTGTNSYAGATTVQAGTLLINGDQSGADGLTSVASGATLGGLGTIGGSVEVADGGTISPGNSPGTLTIDGDLTLNAGSVLDYEFGEAGVVGGPLNDLIIVGGDLVLNGTLNVTETPDGDFGPGLYRIIRYDGTRSGAGLSLGAVPPGDLRIQTAVPNQVNLINMSGVELNFWDGPDGTINDNAISGGAGTWSLSGDEDWTSDTGAINAPYANGTFAIFTGAPGTVEVDNGSGDVEASGLQFAVDGYTISGDPLTLVGSADDPSASIIRVGDGTTEAAAMTATIEANLIGASQLVKTDLGTLVLAGTNSYAGGTRIEAGTLSVAGDENLGDAAGALTFDGGTVQNTAAFTSARSVTLEDGGGTVETEADLALSGVIGGAGALTKQGAETLTLSGTNSYAGGTFLNEGVLSVAGDENLGDTAGGLTFDGGTLQNTASFTSARDVTLNAAGGTIQTEADLILSGVIGGAGAFTKTGASTLTLSGENTYTGGTTIAAGTVQLGAGGASGSIAGNVTNDGTLAFNRSDTYSFAGVIAGGGAVNQIGSGITILTGDNTYDGPTTVQAGGLLINGDQSGADGLTAVESGGTLGGLGIIGGDVVVADGGAISPGGIGAAPDTLTINGGLTLNDSSDLNYNFGQANVVGGPLNDLIRVGGDLVLDGALNVTETLGGDFSPGLYRIISYGGALSGAGLSLGAMPTGDFAVQTAVAEQVNLVNMTGVTLNFWDGPDGDINDNTIHGGDGTWRLAGDEDWTDDTGGLNGVYANGAFAVFAGAPGTVSVDNTDGQVEAAGLQFASDGYVIAGSALILVGSTASPGSSIIRVGDGTADGAAMTATIEVDLSGDSALVKADLGTLVLTGTNSYTGGTVIEDGTLQIASDANLGEAAGALTLDGGTLHTTAAIESGRAVTLESAGTFRIDEGTTLTLTGTVDGAGALTKAGGGALVVAAASFYSGATTVADGTLRAGAVDVFSPSSTVSVLDGGELDLAGFSQTMGSLANAGIVHLSGAPSTTLAVLADAGSSLADAATTLASGAPGATLTVLGDYVGNGGTITFNTVLGDDSSATDRLVVNGDTSGASTVRVSNVGGGGGQTVEGIKLIDVAGASDGSFTLEGDYAHDGAPAVVAGAYAYQLFQGGTSTPADGDWYLRSVLLEDPGGDDDDPLYQAGVPLYEAYGGTLQAFNQLGTLQQRVGSRLWAGGAGPVGADALADGTRDGNGLWVRIEGAQASIDPETSTSDTDYDVTTWKLQVGADRLLSESQAGRLIGGVSAHYGTISSDVASVHGRGGIETTAYGLGATLTWYGAAGFYVDGQAQVTRFDSDLRSATAGRDLVDDNDGTGYAVSLEAGQRIALTGRWSVTPQAQLAYSAERFDGFTDAFGADVSLDRSRSLTGRLGATIDHRAAWQDAAGRTSGVHLYGLANLYYDFTNGSRVDVAGTRFKSEAEPLRGGVGLGGALDWADGKYAIYGEAQATSSLEDFGDSHGVSGTVGFRLRW